MRRTATRILCLFLCLLIAAGTGGCALFPDRMPEFVGSTEKLSLGSPYKHYFETLSDTEKTAYNAVLSQSFEFPQRIEIPPLTKDELSEMYTALLYDNPELFFLGGDTVMRQIQKRTYLYPTYRMGITDYDAMFRKCSEIAAQIVDDAAAEKTPFARERAVHDRLIAMCSFTDEEADIYKGTIYGVLCGAEASCEGYAKTAKYLLDQLDIPCFVILGNSALPGSRTQIHMWNAVQLDEAWYHLDLTWDDPVLEKGGSLIRYSYFNVTDDMLGKTHTDYDAGVACTATKYNFFVHEGLLLSQFGEDEADRAADYAAQLLDAGSDGFQLRFADEESYENAQKTLFEEESIYALLKQIGEQTNRSFATNEVTYYTTDEDYAIEIIPVQ